VQVKGAVETFVPLVPLSTQYFRIWAKPGLGAVSLELTIPSCARESRPAWRLLRTDSVGSGPRNGSSKIALPDNGQDYAVLVVSNDGTPARRVCPSM